MARHRLTAALAFLCVLAYSAEPVVVVPRKVVDRMLAFSQERPLPPSVLNELWNLRDRLGAEPSVNVEPDEIPVMGAEFDSQLIEWMNSGDTHLERVALVSATGRYDMGKELVQSVLKRLDASLDPIAISSAEGAISNLIDGHGLVAEWTLAKIKTAKPEAVEGLLSRTLDREYKAGTIL